MHSAAISYLQNTLGISPSGFQHRILVIPNVGGQCGWGGLANVGPVSGSYADGCEYKKSSGASVSLACVCQSMQTAAPG